MCSYVQCMSEQIKLCGRTFLQTRQIQSCGHFQGIYNITIFGHRTTELLGHGVVAFNHLPHIIFFLILTDSFPYLLSMLSVVNTMKQHTDHLIKDNCDTIEDSSLTKLNCLILCQNQRCGEDYCFSEVKVTHTFSHVCKILSHKVKLLLQITNCVTFHCIPISQPRPA